MITEHKQLSGITSDSNEEEINRYLSKTSFTKELTRRNVLVHMIHIYIMVVVQFMEYYSLIWGVIQLIDGIGKI